MGAAQHTTASAHLLTLMLAGVSCAALSLALVTKREERGWRSRGRAAMHRAALAESALADLRRRRSEAVAKGNRKRASEQAAQRQTVTEELRRLAVIRKTPPQGALALDSEEHA